MISLFSGSAAKGKQAVGTENDHSKVVSRTQQLSGAYTGAYSLLYIYTIAVGCKRIIYVYKGIHIV